MLEPYLPDKKSTNFKFKVPEPKRRKLFTFLPA